MRVAIHQPNLLPWLGYYAKVAQADVLVVLDDVPFSKGSFTNRVQIRGRDGLPTWLTLPIQHATAGRIDRTLIARLDSVDDVCEDLFAAYGGAPHVAPILGDLMQRMKAAAIATSGSLGAINFASALALAKWFGIERKFERVLTASQIRKEVVPGVPGLIEMVKAIGGTTYVAGGGAGAYDDPAAWSAAGIAYRPTAFKHPTYPCGRGEFVPGLSALDLLMWDYPNAPLLLRGSIR